MNSFKPLLLSCFLSARPPQVDLGFLRFVSAVGTQGAISQETRRIYYVRSYKVDVSSNGEDWITLKEGSKQKVDEGFCVILVCFFAFCLPGLLPGCQICQIITLATCS